MRYEGAIYRPPSEAYSLLVQVTIGCTHNKCTFCSMFKEKRFRVRKVEEVLEDLDMARLRYRRVERIFLCDGDALCLSMDKLTRILDYINRLFPECRQINVYGRANDVLRKTRDELALLCAKGVKIIYIGAESGSDRVLTAVKKGVCAAELIEAVQRIEASGIKASVTFISGLAGRGGWQEHAIETGKMISAMDPTYVGLLTLMVEPGAPLYEDISAGRFELLSPEEVIAETKLLIENIDVSGPCVFRSNHASNYISLAGTFNKDTNKLLEQIAEAEKRNVFKPEYYRGF